MAERWRVPFASSEAVQRRMSAQRRKDTLPELALRKRLHAMGMRYRVDAQPLPSLRRRADVVFPRECVAVFVDGCFWHGCPEHGRRLHAVNGWYWPEKIARNQRRDADTDDRLRRAAWTVIRVWEHEPSSEAAQQIKDAVLAARAAAGVNAVRVDTADEAAPASTRLGLTVAELEAGIDRRKITKDGPG